LASRVVKSMKIEVDALKNMKIRGWEGLGAALGAFRRSLAKLWPGFVRKLSPEGAQDRLSARQVRARVAQVGPWRSDGNLVDCHIVHNLPFLYFHYIDFSIIS